MMKRLISTRPPPPLTDAELQTVLGAIEREREAMSFSAAVTRLRRVHLAKQSHLRALPCIYDPTKAAAVRKSRPVLRPVRTYEENLQAIMADVSGVLGMLNEGRPGDDAG